MSIDKDLQTAPNLRFKGFTDDWEQRKLSDLIQTMRGGASIAPNDYKDTGVATVPKGAINPTGVADLSGSKYVSKNFFEKNGNSTVTSGGLVTSLRDLVPSAPNMGRIVKVKGKCQRYLMPQGVYSILLQDKVDENFLISFSNTSKFRKIISKEKNGSTQVHIRNSEYLGITINTPGIEEQNQIGNFLKQLDNAITLHQRKLDQLNRLKEALLQQMFPGKGETVPKLRFAGFEGDWKERKLGDTLVELKSGLSRMLSNNDIGLPVIRANNIKNGMLDLEADIKYWYSDDPQGANTENYLVEKEDILINFINSDTKMGTAAIVREAISRNTIYTTNILKAQTNSDFNSYFWFTLTQTLQYKNSIKMITKPAVNQSSFTTVDFKRLIFVFPKLSEQSKIGKLFKELDNYIVLQSQKVNKLKLMKELLLQNMFI